MNLFKKTFKQENTLSTNNITRDAFRYYVFTSIISINEIKHDYFTKDNIKNGFLWALEIIDFTFDLITQRKYYGYSQKGLFSTYDMQVLQPATKVFMDMFEELIFGNNNPYKNRIVELSFYTKNLINLKMHSIYFILNDQKDSVALAKEFKKLYLQIMK